MTSTVSTVITKLVHHYGNVSRYCNETAVKTKTLALAVKENIVYRNIWLGNTYKRERQRETERDRGERQRRETEREGVRDGGLCQRYHREKLCFT